MRFLFPFSFQWVMGVSACASARFPTPARYHKELVGETPEMRRMNENSSVPFPEMESIPAPWKTYPEPESSRILCDVNPAASI